MTNVPTSAQSVAPNLKALLIGRTIKTHIRMIRESSHRNEGEGGNRA
jgi:hypothetical protein